MRIIPIFLIGIGLLTACTTEPERPDDTPMEEPPPAPVLVCEESCTKDADCAPVPAGAPAEAKSVCCLDGDKEGALDVCGPSNRCLVTHLDVTVDTSNHPTTTCQKDADCGDGACIGGLCFACAVPPMGDATKPSKYCKDPKRPYCVFDATDPGLTSCSECVDDTQCAGNKSGNNRCAAVPVPETAAPFGSDAATGTVNLCVCNQDSSCKEVGKNSCRAEGCVCSSDAGCATGEACYFGVCVACGSDAGCKAKDDGDPSTPNPGKCFGGGAPGAYCGCTKDAECGADGDGNPTFCEKTTGTCIACRTNTDCKGELNVCINGGKADATCGCNANTKCANGLKCIAPGTADSFCGCAKNADCKDDPAGGICDTMSGKCTQCVMDADCTAQKLGDVCSEGACTCSAGTQCGAPKSAPALKWVCE